MKMETFRIQDLYTAAFCTLSGLAYSLEKKGSKVLFCFEPTPDLYKALQAFNEGISVDVAEFTREVKRLRAIMYEAREVCEKGGLKNDC